MSHVPHSCCRSRRPLPALRRGREPAASGAWARPAALGSHRHLGLVAKRRGCTVRCGRLSPLHDPAAIAATGRLLPKTAPGAVPDAEQLKRRSRARCGRYDRAQVCRFSSVEDLGFRVLHVQFTGLFRI